MPGIRTVGVALFLMGLSAGIRFGVNEPGLIFSTAFGEEADSSSRNSSWHLRKRSRAPLGLVGAVRFSHDGELLVIGCGWGSAYIHDPRKGAVVVMEIPSLGVRHLWKTDCTGRPDAVGFSRDDTRVVACWGGGRYSVWDCRSGRALGALTGPRQAGPRPALSTNAELAAWSCADGKIRVWDLFANRERTAFQAGCFVSMAFSADAKRLATAWEVERMPSSDMFTPSRPQKVRVYTVNEGALKGAFRVDGKGVIWVAISPDGNVVTTAAKGTDLCLWDVAEGRLRHTIKPNAEYVEHPTFSSDGKLFSAVTGTVEEVAAPIVSNVKVWDADSGELLAEVRVGAENQNVYLAFSPDGKMLATVLEAGTVSLWDLPTSKR